MRSFRNDFSSFMEIEIFVNSDVYDDRWFNAVPAILTHPLHL